MNIFDCINKPNIKTERLLINDIVEQDKEKYFCLYTDEKLNIYWGYDYKEDLKDNDLTPDYFYNFMKSLKDKKEEYSLAIRLNNEFIGEGVFHNFNNDGQVEIGIRLLSKYHNFGYGTECLKAMINYIKQFNPSKIIAKCYLQNLPSKNIILKSGFTLIGNDEKYFYFEIK